MLEIEGNDLLKSIKEKIFLAYNEIKYFSTVKYTTLFFLIVRLHYLCDMQATNRILYASNADPEHPSHEKDRSYF